MIFSKVLSVSMLAGLIFLNGCSGSVESATNRDFINDSIDVLGLLRDANAYHSTETDSEVKMYEEIYTKIEKYESAKTNLESWSQNLDPIIKETAGSIQSGFDDLIEVMNLFTSELDQNPSEVLAQGKVLTDSGENKILKGFTDFTLSETLVLDDSDKVEVVAHLEEVFSVELDA